MRFSRSQELHERALRSIPLGTQTLSKSASQFVRGATPLYLERGKGAHVWDVDGNEFIDYPMALGPVILGHADDGVSEAIRAQLQSGISFSLNHPIEVDVAEKIIGLCPGVEAVRFGKSGSDALSAAVRASRAFTGRDVVLVAGYHGWHDWFISTTTRDAGIPKAVAALTATFAYGDLDDLDRALLDHRDDVAAVILEPSGLAVPEPGYLDAVCEMAAAAGAISVFDEVITGFRLAPGGARQRYGVEPDLSCYGKALGNGMPISAVGGKWEVMRVFEDIFYSGTHSGETLSLAAAASVLAQIADGTILDRIESLGTDLLRGTEALIDKHGLQEVIAVSGEPQRSVISFIGGSPLVTKSYVQQHLGLAGILFNGSMFISAGHRESDIDETITAMDEAFAVVASDPDLGSLLVGAPVEPVFRAP